MRVNASGRKESCKGYLSVYEERTFEVLDWRLDDDGKFVIEY